MPEGRVRFQGKGARAARAPTSRTIHKFFDKEHFDAAAKALSREKRLRVLGDKLGSGLVFSAWFSFGLCVAMLAIYVYLSPKAPHFEVMSAGFVYVQITPLTAAEIAEQQKGGSGNYFAAYFKFNASYTVLFENLNKKVDMYVEYLELTPFFNGFRLGETKSKAFKQARSTSQTVPLNVIQQKLPVPLNVYYTMMSSSGKRTFFGADIKMKGKISTVAGIRSPPFLFRMHMKDQSGQVDKSNPPGCIAAVLQSQPSKTGDKH